MNKKIKILSILLFITIIILGIIKFNNQKVTIEETKLPKKEVKETNDITTLYFVGDIMLTRGVKNSVNKNFEGDYNKLFENLTELKEADILFGNLEGAVSNIGNNVGSKYSFRMDQKILPVLKNAGFDIVSFANNHVGDWNIKAFEDTLKGLEENNILKTGAGKNKYEAEEPIIIEKNGIRFGFIGFSDVGPNWIEAKINSPGILLANDPNFNEIIKNAKIKSDVLIVSFHFGEEYKLIHNKRQEILARSAIDNGADMVIGHHPHVIEDIENYKGKIIVYSLGNFIFDQYFSQDTMRGMLFTATFKNKNLIKTDKKIIKLNREYKPEGIFSIEEIERKNEEENVISVCPKPTKKYPDMFLFNVNQKNELPDINYIPDNLVEIDEESTTKKICLIKEANDSLTLMLKKARRDGISIKVSSGFRDYDYQKNLFNNEIKKINKNISNSVAKPGYSEHQLGTTIDLTGKSINYISASIYFNDTPEDKWLRENAYLYGFIQSYPQNKESVTGYKYEPWHYRYVGIEKAKEIKESKITLIEFLNNI